MFAKRLYRQLDYAKYLLGLRKSEHIFNFREVPERISILIPDSLGDIAINSSITQYFKWRFPGVAITLITHPKYIKAGNFDPNYDFVLSYPSRYLRFEPWALNYETQLKIARELTPNMDRLYFCQPSAWCDHLVAKYPLFNLQNYLCKVPAKDRFMPKLIVPKMDEAQAKRFRSRLKGPVILISREAYTATFGSRVSDYWERLINFCVNNKIIVLDNSRQCAIEHEHCLAVGEMPLAEIVALAGLCDGVIAVRSGLSDLIGFSVQCHSYTIYPAGNYPFSQMTFLKWCSLIDMGVEFATERQNSFMNSADVEAEFAHTANWLYSKSLIC